MTIHNDIRYEKLIKDLEAFHIEGNEAMMHERLDQLQAISEKDQDAIGLTATYFYRGLLTSNKKEDETFTLKAHSLAIAKEIPYYEMKTYNRMGISQSQDADFYASLKHYLSAHQIAKDHPEYKFEGIVLNNLGNLFVWLNEYETAVAYLEQAFAKYMEDQVDDRIFLVTLIINIVEMYSGIHDYEKIEYWNRQRDIVEFRKEETLVLDCILMVSEVIHAVEQMNHALAREKTTKFIEMAEQSSDFIYIFRCYLNALEASLEYDEEELSAKLIAKMQLLNDEAPMDTFYYDFANLKIEFYKKYKARRAADTNPDFDFYFVQSRNRIKQLENTYARSLFAEIELNNSRFENQNMLRENLQLQKDVELDPFTGLYNKTSTIARVTHHLANANSESYHAMLIVDIDYFKNVNDFYGHDYGDLVISQIADILKSIPCDEKVVGRFGGDEYLLFFPDLSHLDALYAAIDSVYEKVYQISIPDHQIEMITLSIGISLVTESIRFEDLFKRTDQALYVAKRNGRNQYSLYTSDMKDLVKK